jgi:hypothetical protein
MPWSRKKVVNTLESALVVSPIFGRSPLFCILRSAVNSLPTSHPIVTIPNRQLSSLQSRSGDSGWMVGKPYLTGLRKGCPSSARERACDNRCAVNHGAGWIGLAVSMAFSCMMIFGSSDVAGRSQSSSVGSREKIRPELTARNAATAIATSKTIENTERQMNH